MRSKKQTIPKKNFRKFFFFCQSSPKKIQTKLKLLKKKKNKRQNKTLKRLQTKDLCYSFLFFLKVVETTLKDLGGNPFLPSLFAFIFFFFDFSLIESIAIQHSCRREYQILLKMLYHTYFLFLIFFCKKKREEKAPYFSYFFFKFSIFIVLLWDSMYANGFSSFLHELLWRPRIC